MNNNGMKPLNTTDGWENIVNSNAAEKSAARERVAARKKAQKVKKLQTSAIAMAAACIVTVVLGAAGVVADWLATTTAVALLVAASVMSGRFVEARKQ